MKKKILTLILPAVAMITAACGETKPCDHKDENKDHLCDVCGERISDHIDENPKDHKCDICEQSMGEHADKNNDHNCDYCGAKMSEHVDSNKDHKCDVCEQPMGEHADKDNDHKCDYCGEKMSEHIDSNLNHECDICGAEMGEHADNNHDHNCDYCGEKMSEHIDSNLNHECDICGAEMGEHADNNHDHNCDYCGEKMSEHTQPNEEGKCDICGEKIADPVVNSVQFLDSAVELEKGKFHTLSVIVDAKYGASSEVEFSSEDESVAKVDAQGKITAIDAGNTKVWAVSKFDNSKKASIAVKVTDPEIHHDPVITSVTVSPASANIDEGKTVQLAADVKGLYNYSTEVRWSSSNEAVATVSSTGLVSGLKAGDAVITATSVQDGTKSAQASIHVSAVAPAENKELEKFNELVASLKTKHNYEMSVLSEVEIDGKTDTYTDHFINYNNIVLESEDHDTGLDGYGFIYQKDQGYVDYYRSGSGIAAQGFVSTNPDIKISDFYQIIAENLFLGDYEQDSTNKAKFVTTSEDSMAVACQFTGYGDYVSVGVLQRDTSMSAEVDMENDTLTIKLNYWLRFFDEYEHNDPGQLTLVISNFEEVDGTLYENYIKNPTRTFEAQTAWSETDKYIFDLEFSSYYPPFPEGASYALSGDADIYEGFERGIFIDKASGDLRDSYGAQLISDGFEKKDSKTYKKVVLGDNVYDKTTLTVILDYSDSSVAYPNGIMRMYFRSQDDLGYFESIDEFNGYLEANSYDQLVPKFPASSGFVKIDNFKNQISGAEGMEMKINSSDTFHVWFNSYADASTWANLYIARLTGRHYDDMQSFLGMKNYHYDEEISQAYVGLDFPAEANFKGWIGVRFMISSVDAPNIRTRDAEVRSIAVSGYNTSFETGSTFSFGGTCTATFSNGATRALNSSEFVCSGYSMNEEGKQTVTVAYTGDSSIKTSYEIEVKTTREVTKIELGGSPTLQFVKNGTFNHTGLFVKAIYDNGNEDYVGNDENCTYDVDLSSTGIKDVTVSYKYHDKTVTAKYQILVNETLTWPSISFESTENLLWADIYDSYGDQEISEFNYNQESSFFVDVYPVEGFSIDSISIKNDPDAQIIYDYDMYMYKVIPTINLEMSEIVVCVELSGEEVVKYNVTSATLEHGSITLSGAKYKPGDTVQFTVNPDSGYSIESVSSDPTVVISEVSAGKYQFVMPAEDVELSASFSLIPTSHSIATSVTGSGSINSITVNGVAGTNAMAGDTVLIDAKASDTDVYRVKSAVITTDGGNNVEWTKKAGKYQFTMPEDNVTFNIVFEEIPSYAISKDTTHTNISYNIGVTGNTAKAGDPVVFKPISVEGYVVDKSSISVTMTETGETVKCIEGSSDTYQFTMPEGPVTIHASSNALYSVSVNDSITNGTINLTKTSFIEGEKVTFSVSPASGYEVDTVSASDGSAIALTDEGNNTYSFIMPAKNVSLNATFKASEGPAPECPYIGTYTSGDYSIVIEDESHGYQTYGQSIVHFTYVVVGGNITFTKDMQATDRDNELDASFYYLFYYGVTEKAGTIDTSTGTIKFTTAFNRTFTKQ